MYCLLTGVFSWVNSLYAAAPALASLGMNVYSGDCCHLIQCKSATQSGGSLPLNPMEACHPIQTKAATLSERSDAWFE
jgi:hypothetical protein